MVNIYKKCILDLLYEMNFNKTTEQRKWTLPMLTIGFDLTKYLPKALPKEIYKTLMQVFIKGLNLSNDDIEYIKNFYKTNSLEDLTVEDFSNPNLPERIINLTRFNEHVTKLMFEGYVGFFQNEILDKINYSDMMIIVDLVIKNLRGRFVLIEDFIRCAENKIKMIDHMRN